MISITRSGVRPRRLRMTALIGFLVLCSSCSAAGDFLEDQAIREFEEGLAEEGLTGEESASEGQSQPVSDPTASNGEISVSAGEVDCAKLQEELQVLGVQAQLLAQYRPEDPEGWKADLDEFELLQLDRFEQSLDAFETIADTESMFGRVGDSLDTYRQASTFVQEGRWDEMTELNSNSSYVDLMLRITGGMGEAGC